MKLGMGALGNMDDAPSPAIFYWRDSVDFVLFSYGYGFMGKISGELACDYDFINFKPALF
jgi:hypothetical protein